MIIFTYLVACTAKTPIKPDDTQVDTSPSCDTAIEADTGIQIGSIDAVCRCEEALVTIGTGEFEWMDLTEDAPLTMVHGPQGGWHMLGSARVCGTRNVVTIHYTIVHDETQTVVSDNTYRVALVLEEDSCCGHYPGMYGFLTVHELTEGELDTPPEIIACDTVTISMEVTDSGGRMLESSKSVVAAPDPSDSDTPCP